jgi:hypothetical protein
LLFRWNTLQKSTLLFTSIYNQISKNPALGSAPTNWLVEAKQTFYEQEGHQLVFERAWNHLKLVEKWQNMAKKGKAKNCQSNKGTGGTGKASQGLTEDKVSNPAANATGNPNDPDSKYKGQGEDAFMISSFFGSCGIGEARVGPNGDACDGC